MKLSAKIKKLIDIPKALDGFAPREAIDERFVLRLHIFGYRIIIYKTMR